MANLVQKTENILINDLKASDFGVYAKDGSNVLLYKGSKHHAPYEVEKSKIARKFFSKSREGQKASYFMELVAPAPCEDCNYETGISIGYRKHWDGSVWDSNPQFRYIAAHLPSIGTAVSGELNDDDKLNILQQMIEQINADNYGPAKATMAYIVSDDDTTDASTVDITINGTTTTISDTNDLANAINGDSDVAPYVQAYHLEEGTGDTDKVVIVGKNDDLFFLVEEGTDTTIENFYLKLSEREVNKPMQIKWVQHQADWNPVTKVFQWEVEYSSDLDMTLHYQNSAGSGTSTAFVNDNNIATTIANMVAVDNVAAIQTTDDSGSVTGNIGIFVYNYNNAWFTVDDAAADVPTVIYGNQEYAHLTSHDMYRIFPNVGDNQGMDVYLPDPDANYCQVHFELSDTLPDNTLPGASATVNNIKIVNFFIKESDIVDELWGSADLMDDDPATVNRCFFDLLLQISSERPDGLSVSDPTDLELADGLTSNEWH